MRAIWEALYGVRDGVVRPDAAAIPGTTPPDGLPTFAEDGAILPPSRTGRGELVNRLPRLDCVLLDAVLALLILSTLLVWSATLHRVDLTGGDPTAYLRRQLVNIVIGLVLIAR